MFPELLRNLENDQERSLGIAEQAFMKKVYSEVAVAVKRQLSSVKFYRGEEISEGKLSMLSKAPLTNSGCESNLSDMTYDVVRSAGSFTKMQTISNKNVIRKNKVFDSTRWKRMSREEKVAKWKWARSSIQGKRVREIGRTYFEKVKAAKALSSAEKERKKKKKRAKALKLLEQCKAWNGPVTKGSVGELEKLDEYQLLIEVRYLRTTIAPDIREKRKEGNKFVKFSKEELVFQIRNAIKLTAENTVDIGNLLSCVLGLEVETKNEHGQPNQVEVVPRQVVIEGGEKESQKTEPGSSERENLMNSESQEQNLRDPLPPGLVGQFSGPLDELKVGVVISVGNESMLQLYESKRYGFVPALTAPEPIENWLLLEEIEDFQYVQYPSMPSIVFLKF